MLVLRRKVGEAIRINDNIRIIIQEVQQGRIVRFAIDAPVEVPVHRLEIYRLIQKENQRAAHAVDLDWLKGCTEKGGTTHEPQSEPTDG